MIQQDIILRQILNLAHVLAQVLFRRPLDQPVEAQHEMADGLARVLGMDLETFRTSSQENTLARCAPGEPLAGEISVAAVALLSEDVSRDGRQRALWLYEWALDSGQAVPFDVHERIASLRAPWTQPRGNVTPCPPRAEVGDLATDDR